MKTNNKLSTEDKQLIEEHLNGDLYSKTDPENQIRPEISPVDYYRLHNMDFNWAVLSPLSKMVAEYLEQNQLDLTEAIAITSPEQKLLFFWWYLDGQVTNGGFSQFIDNGYDKYFPPVLNGLKLLPNKKYYELVEKVYFRYLKGRLSTINQNNIPYFKINAQLYKDVEAFIREHQEQFIKPIDKKYTGRLEYRTGNILEVLEVKKGVPEGKYEKYVDDVKVEEIVYRKGKQVAEKKFKEGLPYEETRSDDTVKNMEHTLKYYPNGQLESHTKKIVKDSYNSNMVFKDRFYDTGIIKAQYWEDETEKIHIKRYFDDGQIRSYHTLKKIENERFNKLSEYLICFDENRKETLINGNGIFYDYDFKEENSRFSFYSYVVNCENYLSNGESIGYQNGKLWLKRTFINGIEHGLNIEYDDNGNEEAIREYESGKFVRVVKQK
ncbi:DMP19 family protein [Chitinophaga pinensis]|uniref:DNA mimic protein DMP19 C-terminal domain-containing protein n=1 Tax=Chitinophaga pinensis (strain ATCC 43595 / DSM 2588 / LMG 13176 / NBRC 15968 / NCIMB 11800 / UQM 2034) TaxID=485918 RepID=A0A979GZ21_CHIPD|nr:DUF4375 domain-containing protein [Chitinophaga pinensis]ACU63591.1 hypothetical protein Cpin_6185 [Chitinophaga pinensis DSM 2588]